MSVSHADVGVQLKEPNGLLGVNRFENGKSGLFSHFDRDSADPNFVFNNQPIAIQLGILETASRFCRRGCRLSRLSAFGPFPGAGFEALQGGHGCGTGRMQEPMLTGSRLL